MSTPTDDFVAASAAQVTSQTTHDSALAALRAARALVFLDAAGECKTVDPSLDSATAATRLADAAAKETAWRTAYAALGDAKLDLLHKRAILNGDAGKTASFAALKTEVAAAKVANKPVVSGLGV